jgi:protein-disulfide isomerase/thiol-disulfide isomerase/thioredoxin
MMFYRKQVDFSWQRILVLSLLMVAVLVLALPTLAVRERDESANDGTTPPVIVATAYDGTEIDLADYYGEAPIIINFWATWEPSSLTDTTILQDVYDAYGDDVFILGINHFDPDEVAIDFLATQGITYSNVPDDGTLAPAFNIGAIPKTIIVDADGQIASTIDTPLEREALLALLSDVAGIEVASDTSDEGIDAPIPPNIGERYTDLPFGITEEGYPILGERDAAIQILYFGSFSCPFCLNFHDDVFERLVDEFDEGDIAFTYVPVYMTGSVPNGEGANRAAICAGEQEQFWAYMDVLYDWHARFGERAFLQERLRQGAINLDLDMASWDMCLGSESTNEVIASVIPTMETFNVRGTPTVIINGISVTASYDAIMREIEQLRGNRT